MNALITRNTEASLLWTLIEKKLSLKQFEKCMFKTYKERAEIVLRISKNKELHGLANDILKLYSTPTLTLIQGESPFPISGRSRANLTLLQGGKS